MSTQNVTHSYVLRFPAHAPRKDDPHYALFEAYRKAHVATAKCYVGQRVGFEHCQGGLELHHDHLEFAVLNAVDLKALQVDFPDVTDEDALQRWAESEPNFRFLCEKHHRGSGGAHVLAHADWEASVYDPSLTGD